MNPNDLTFNLPLNKVLDKYKPIILYETCIVLMTLIYMYIFKGFI